ncbi:hypothetical protein G5I_09745 [Acromyrmex echinatior]|uniref:Uncharacterized protein n=1 Tax=Acromyrmex echinatior TaxID=103372 RepID=F4WV79_ACREC|nr:hypothetical protein G5I_09745 [Acromyrmex echinatior]
MSPGLKFVIRCTWVIMSSECRYGKICVGERVRIQINVSDGQCDGQWKEVKEVKEGEGQDSRRIGFLATGVLKIEHSESHANRYFLAHIVYFYDESITKKTRAPNWELESNPDEVKIEIT